MMILIAAFAVGTVAVRSTLPDLATLDADLLRSPSPGMQRFLRLQYGLSAFIPYLTSLTPALVIMRLSRPRPRLRRAASQPGMVACSVASVAMLIEGLWIVSLLAVGSRFIHASTVFVGYAQQISFAVLGAWATLGLSGRWRAEPNWIDRLGRLVGVAWIGVTVVSWSQYFLI